MGSAESGGLGIIGTVFIVFLILKLVGVIEWSWWWVLSPLWIPVVLFVVVGLIVLLIIAGLKKIW